MSNEASPGQQPAEPPPSPPFTTRAALTEAMRDERYAPEINGRTNPKHDPAYRLEVLRRGDLVAREGSR